MKTHVFTDAEQKLRAAIVQGMIDAVPDGTDVNLALHSVCVALCEMCVETGASVDDMIDEVRRCYVYRTTVGADHVRKGAN